MKKGAWVVKFGGSLLSDAGARGAFLKQAAALARKVPLVLVHGGGPEINAALQQMNVKSVWVAGRRVTDLAAMRVVEMVLSGEVNKRLVGELSLLKVKAAGLSGRDGLLTAKPVADLGLVGVPVKADPSALKALLAAGITPVVSPVSSDGKGGALNVNADEAAAALAVSLKAERLVFLTDVAGVLDADKKTISVIHVKKELEKLIKAEVITGGMIPKTRSCADALKKGVGEVDIVDGRAGLLKMKGTRLLS